MMVTGIGGGLVIAGRRWGWCSGGWWALTGVGTTASEQGLLEPEMKMIGGD